jgi:hypothetical protein
MPHGPPYAVTPIVHWATMQFDISGVPQPKTGNAIVGCSDLMVDAALENCDPAENKILLVRVLYVP